MLRVLGDDDTISLQFCQELIAEANVSVTVVCGRARVSLSRPPAGAIHDTKACSGAQSQFKDWRAARNLTEYLPDEYQYHGDEADTYAPITYTLPAGLRPRRERQRERREEREAYIYIYM